MVPVTGLRIISASLRLRSGYCPYDYAQGTVRFGCRHAEFISASPGECETKMASRWRSGCSNIWRGSLLRRDDKAKRSFQGCSCDEMEDIMPEIKPLHRPFYFGEGEGGMRLEIGHKGDKTQRNEKRKNES